MKSLTYTCSRCGKEAELGKHFCDGSVVRKTGKRDRDPDADLGYDAPGQPERKHRSGNRVLASGTVIALIVLALFSYRILGGRILIAAAAAVPLVLAIIFKDTLKSLLPDSRKELIRLCRGDESLAERLIQAELRRNAGISEKEAVRSAIRRLTYDRLR